jgi:tRNA threonylcarbamoyladenosine biosynthesis protein TsaB
MAVILNIETSTPICSVALAKNGVVVAVKENEGENLHASQLAIYIEEIFKEANISIKDIDAVAVSEGPGSYTGLRIGVSTAKGIAYAADKKLIAVSTLQSIAIGAKLSGNFSENAWFCPMIDARRMEVFMAFYDFEGKQQSGVSAKVITENDFEEELNLRPIVFAGNGAEKCKSLITHHNALFIKDIKASAKYMAMLSEKNYEQKNFKDVAYFEPFYLKDFVATVSQKNVFGN